MASKKPASKSTSKPKASSAKKKSASPKTSASASKKKETKKSLASSKIVQVILIFIAWALEFICLFSMGSFGRIIKALLSIFMGSLLYPVLIGLMAWQFWYLWTRGKKKFPIRYAFAIIFGVLFWSLCTGLVHTPADQPWSSLQALNASLPTFASGSFYSPYGYLGALLAGVFVSAFSKTGAWIFDIVFLLCGILMIAWDLSKVILVTVQSSLSARRKRKKEEKELPEEEGEEEKPKKNSWFSRWLEPEEEQEEETVPAMDEKLLVNDIAGKDTAADFAGGKNSAGQVIEPTIYSQGEKQDLSKLEAEAQPFSIFDEERKKEKEREKAQKKHEKIERARQKSSDLASSAAKEEPSVSPVQHSLDFESAMAVDYSKYKLPPEKLLLPYSKKKGNNANIRNAREDGEKLIQILSEFGVDATLSNIHIGPVVTKFEIIPGQGVRVNTFTNLQNDIKLALAATDIRVEAPISGKSAVGIEVPNAEKTSVAMRDLISTIPEAYQEEPLVFCLGKDLMGNNVYGRLDTMPHLLIAGATGSGKSVCVNSIICSLLMRTRPDEVKLLLIDPKKVEFTPYNDVPHLLSPVITDGELAAKSLKVIVEMMERRYELFTEVKVKNIYGYNHWVETNPDSGHLPMSRILVIIDELADLMLVASKDVENSIQRITQLARAAGIHLIVATQRPSVNVITGVIKANIPARIAFAVSSATDSRTILDCGGADRLLGHGDMLFLDNGDSAPRRIQGVFIQDEEVNNICDYVKAQAAPRYDDAFITLKDLQNQGTVVEPSAADPLYDEVKQFVISSRKASTSMVQRRFQIGYQRAARILDMLEANGIIGPSNGSKPREVYAGESDGYDSGDYV